MALYQRSRCYVALTKVKEALTDLNKVVELSPNDKVARNDRDCLKCLSMCTGADVDSTSVDKSIVALTQLINNEKIVYFQKQLLHSSIVHHPSQIIPSANRTKIDKIRTIKKMREKRRMKSLELGDESIDDDEYDLDIEVEDIGEIDDQAVADESNYYKENIFNKEDYYLFRAVMYFYSDDFEKAISDFKQTSRIMHANKTLHQTQNNFAIDDGGDVDNVSHASSQTDLSDVGLCSLNVHEFSYNISL